MSFKFIKFRATEKESLFGTCIGKYIVEGFVNVTKKDTDKDGVTKVTKIKKWITVHSILMPKDQALKIAEEMNENIDNINKSQAEEIYEKNTKKEIEANKEESKQS